MGLVDPETIRELHAKEQALRSRTILLVDDEEAILKMLSRALGKDYNVLTADSAQEALDLIDHLPNPENIQIILSDQRMPGMSGVDFLELTIHKVPNAKRILLTGYAELDIIIDAINRARIYKFITKPYDLEDMKLTILRAVEVYDLEVRNTRLITELQGMIEELGLSLRRQAEAEKMALLGGYVAGIAHEVSTPLGVTITAASHLKQVASETKARFQNGQLKRSDLEKFLTKTEESSSIILTNQERASELMRSFKDIAVDQTSKRPRRFNVRTYLDEILLSLRPKLKRTQHQINVVCSPTLEIDSYPGALSQILTNFIMNSLIHGFEELSAGEITIEICKKEEGYVHLCYKDNGKGLSTDSLPRIFDPFYTTKKEAGGSGIGLHIVHNLVKETLKGEIHCYSELGKGVMFTIDFPLDN